MRRRRFYVRSASISSSVANEARNSGKNDKVVGETKTNAFWRLMAKLDKCVDRPWIEVEAYNDKSALIELLSPNGPLLKHMILTRFDNDLRFDFPVSLLPVRPPFAFSFIEDVFTDTITSDCGTCCAASIPDIDQRKEIWPSSALSEEQVLREEC